LVPYAKWLASESLAGGRRVDLPSGMPASLAAHARFAADGLYRGRLEISAVMRKHQLKLADRQCRMAELSQRLQDLGVMLTTSLWAARQENEVVRSAADILCQDLARKITGKRPSDAYFRAVTKLGETIARDGYPDIAGIEAEPILMPYEPEREAAA